MRKVTSDDGRQHRDELSLSPENHFGRLLSLIHCPSPSRVGKCTLETNDYACAAGQLKLFWWSQVKRILRATDSSRNSWQGMPESVEGVQSRRLQGRGLWSIYKQERTSAFKLWCLMNNSIYSPNFLISILLLLRPILTSLEYPISLEMHYHCRK